MAQEIITLECTEAKALGKPVSRYMRNVATSASGIPNAFAFGSSAPAVRTLI